MTVNVNVWDKLAGGRAEGLLRQLKLQAMVSKILCRASSLQYVPLMHDSLGN